MDECAKAILDKIPDADREHVEKVVKKMREEYRKAFLDGMTNPKSEFRAKAQAILDNYRRGVEAGKIELMRNIAIKHEINAFTENPRFEKSMKNLGTLSFKWENSKVKGLEAWLIGSNDAAIKGSNESVGGIRRGIVNILSTSFQRHLEPGDTQIILSGKLDDAIRIERWELANGRTGGKTGDPAALRIAKAAQDVNSQSRVVLNDSGAFINDLEGHIGRQNHDADAMRAAGFEAWKAKIVNYLDIDKVVNKGLVKGDINAILEDAFESITTSKQQLITNNSDNVAKIIGTPGNVASRLEQGRTLFFKDAESYNLYLKEFGQHKSFGEEMIANINHTARSASLMQKLGTNPFATLEVKLAEYGASKAEKDWILGSIAKELDGSTLIHGKSALAKAQMTHNAVTNALRMGMAVFAQFDDITSRGVNMQLAGQKGFVTPTVNAFTSLLGNMPASSKVHAADITGVGASTLIGDIHDRFSGMDSVAGRSGKISSFVMKMTGMSWLTESNKAAQAQMLSSFFSKHADSHFANLDKNVGATLNRYGIGPVEWDIIRQSSSGGHIGFDAVLELPDAVVKKAMDAGGVKGLTIDRFKRQTSQKMATLYAEEVRAAMRESGDYERAIMYRGTLHDSAFGVASRLVSQYKSFALNSMTQTMDRIALSNGAATWGEAAQGAMRGNVGPYMPMLATLIVGGTAMGALTMASRAMITNKTPPDFRDPKNLMHAFAYGGGAGMYADFLLGEFDHRYGRSALQAIAGPIGGDIDDTFDVLSALRAGPITEDDDEQTKAYKKAGQKAFNAILTRVPNLFYTKGLMDYFVLDRAHEWMSPGYTSRKKQNMQKEGQEFIFEP